MRESPRILLVGQARAEASLVRDLGARGFAFSVTDNSDRALDELLSSRFDLLVVDLGTIDDGMTLIKRVRAVATLTQVPILVVGEWGTGLPSFALSMGADAFEPAPLNADRLLESVRRLLNRRAAAAAAAAGAGK